MEIIVNVIAIAIFFLVRFNGRKDKTKEPDINFWLKDNWEQLVTIVLFDVLLMILAGKNALNLDLSQLTFLPSWMQLMGNLAVAAVIGLLGAFLAYEGYKTIVLNNRKK